jgi:hypothetical protein
MIMKGRIKSGVDLTNKLTGKLATQRNKFANLTIRNITKRKVKIGITINDFKACIKKKFANGLYQHIFTFYEFFDKNTDAEVYIISQNLDEENETYKQIKHDDYRKLKELTYILGVGLRYPEKNYNELMKICKRENIIAPKFYHIVLGNRYHNNLMILSKEDSKKDRYIQYNEVWISDHFNYSKDYYELYYNCKVNVCPYIWNPRFITEQMGNARLKGFENGLHVAIMEPNSSEYFYLKNFIYPLIICERAERHINRAYAFNTTQYVKNDYFLNLIRNMALLRKKKLAVLDRYNTPYVFRNHCNVLVSFQRECELNYLYLECLYLGIPLVHNSKALKDYGYYFEDYDVETAVRHLQSISESFNREEYKARNEGAIKKYSKENERFINFMTSKLGLTYEKDENEEMYMSIFEDKFCFV